MATDTDLVQVPRTELARLRWIEAQMRGLVTGWRGDADEIAQGLHAPCGQETGDACREHAQEIADIIKAGGQPPDAVALALEQIEQAAVAVRTIRAALERAQTP